MVGLQATVFKNKLGPKLNGIINYETWVPSDKMMAPAADFFKKYQARAGAEGVDPLGYYLGGWGYAYINMLGEAITGAKSIDDDKIADWLRKNAPQDHHGRLELRPERRMDQVGHHAGAVPQHQGRRRPRCLAGHELSDRAHARPS